MGSARSASRTACCTSRAGSRRRSGRSSTRIPSIGERILRPLPGFDSVATAVRHAHESWDGHGYPDGLAGEAIPLASRIVLACDAWHALGADRPYRAALPDTEARVELERCAGSQFDPRVVKALLACIDGPDAAEPELALPGEGADTDMLQRLGRELGVLMSLSSAVAAANSLTDLLDLAAEEAREALGAMSVSVSRWEAQAEVLRTTVNVGVLADGELRHPSDEIYRLTDDDPLKQLLLEGRSYLGIIDDPELHQTERLLLERLGRRSCLAVPIMLGDIAWGELWASRGPDQADFDEHDLRLLDAIAGQVAAGVGRAELFGRMAELALQDGLTGLANRRALEERLGMALEEAGEDHEVTLLLCDVDNLKELNDIRGHHGGDWALKAVAGTLRTAAEALPQTLVCRLSGDDSASWPRARASRRCNTRRTPRSTAWPATARLWGCPAASPPAASTVQRPPSSCAPPTRRSTRPSAPAAAASASPTSIPRPPGARPAARAPAAPAATGSTSTPARCSPRASRCSTATCAPPRRSSASRGSRPRSAPALRASAAAVSLCPHGAGVIETLFTLDLRSGHSSSVRFGVDGERYELGVYPRTAELLANGGSLHLYAGDPEADAGRARAAHGLGDERRARRRGLRRPRRLAAGDLRRRRVGRPAPRRRRSAAARRPRGAPRGRAARRAPARACARCRSRFAPPARSAAPRSARRALAVRAPRRGPDRGVPALAVLPTGWCRRRRHAWRRAPVPESYRARVSARRRWTRHRR